MTSIQMVSQAARRTAGMMLMVFEDIIRSRPRE
jgi:hypothetical protein